MSNFDISLINIVFPTDTGAEKYFYVPVGILSLAAFLKQENFSVEVLDYQHTNFPEPGNPDNFYKFISKAQSSVIGIGVMAKDMPGIIIACEKLKKEKPDTVIILGGPGPTGTAFSLMEAFPFIDFVVRGEGELTLLELMKAIKTGDTSFDKIKSLTWRKDEVISNPQRERISDLDSLPLPEYSLVEASRYNQVYLPSTRGCQHFCTFCDQPALWQGKEIRRSLDSLYHEIDYITNELKASWEIAFSDNEFCADPERFDEFYNRYKKGGYGFYFSMDRRVNSLDDDLLLKAKEIGCKTILFGVESGNDRVLKEIRKGFKSVQIKPGLLKSSEYMENSIASFMFNYPFETLKDFLDTASLIYSLWFKKTKNTITFQIHYLSPLPRTPIYLKYKENLIRRDVSNMMISSRNDVQYEQVIDEENKKAAVLPKIFGDNENPNLADERITSLVERFPQIFPSFYIYNSPGIEIKEFIIWCLMAILELKTKNILVRYKENFVYFGSNRIRATGKMEDPDADSIFFRVKSQDLDNGEMFIEALKQSASNRHILLSFELSNLKEEKETGNKICTLLEKLNERGLHFTLLSHIPRSMLTFTAYHRMLNNFNMPEKDYLASDRYYSDSKGILRNFKGKQGKYIWEYENRQKIYSDLC